MTTPIVNRNQTMVMGEISSSAILVAITRITYPSGSYVKAVLQVAGGGSEPEGCDNEPTQSVSAGIVS